MGGLILAVLLAAAVVAAGATGSSDSTKPTCSGQEYDPASYVCPIGKLCPVASPCCCPDAIGYGCFTVAEKWKCASGATCDGSTKGDPLVRGFDGCAWYLQGKPGTVMNLVSEANHVVNTYLVTANITDDHHGSGEGTFHGAISMRYQDNVVTAYVNPEGNLTVFVGDELVPFGDTREHAGVTVKVTQFFMWYGQVAEIVTPAFRFFLHAVQPYNTPGGWSRGHLDFSMTATATHMDMHGLLGQTIKSPEAFCPDDFVFHGEGTETDYIMPQLNSIDFAYSAFAGHQVKRSTRRLQATQLTYLPSATTKSAYTHGFM